MFCVMDGLPTRISVYCLHTVQISEMMVLDSLGLE